MLNWSFTVESPRDLFVCLMLDILTQETQISLAMGVFSALQVILIHFAQVPSGAQAGVWEGPSGKQNHIRPSEVLGRQD